MRPRRLSRVRTRRSVTCRGSDFSFAGNYEDSISGTINQAHNLAHVRSRITVTSRNNQRRREARTAASTMTTTTTTMMAMTRWRVTFVGREAAAKTGRENVVITIVDRSRFSVYLDDAISGVPRVCEYIFVNRGTSTADDDDGSPRVRRGRVPYAYFEKFSRYVKAN